MSRRVFFSFHYRADNWRASQVRNAGVVEGNRPASDNEWERVTRGGAAAIKRWIDVQMFGKSCAVVLIGQKTAGRLWIDYEIKKAWQDGKGVVGIYVHNLKDANGRKCGKGRNPFDNFAIGRTSLSRIVKAYDPPYVGSTNAYQYIAYNLATWIEEAINIRTRL